MANGTVHVHIDKPRSEKISAKIDRIVRLRRGRAQLRNLSVAQDNVEVVADRVCQDYAAIGEDHRLVIPSEAEESGGASLKVTSARHPESRRRRGTSQKVENNQSTLCDAVL